jgi:hypothetical protein|tara:strand:+ start:1055 stop:1240 length:186 start_codon:yes stop_codon:yes gene_type:complete
MAKPNDNFKLNTKDVEHIECALRLLQTSLQDDVSKKEIVNLLAKLYHQKVWYRPKENFVSG